MIWIVTLCLLATFCWFLFNALNEKRWVEAHSHDEAVARDEGFLPSFSAMKTRMSSDADGKVSISQENSRFARAVAKVQEKTATVGAYLERRAAEGRGDGTRPGSIRDEDGFFARTAAKVAAGSEKVGAKLDERARRERRRTAKSPDETGAPVATDDGVFGRAVAKVAEGNERMEERVAERAKRRADDTRSREGQSSEGTFFDRMVDKVGSQSARLDAKLDAQARKARADGAQGTGLDGDDDFVSRVSARVGRRINEIDEKIVDASKVAVGKAGSLGTGGSAGGESQPSRVETKKVTGGAPSPNRVDVNEKKG